jgi:hypothetical protein
VTFRRTPPRDDLNAKRVRQVRQGRNFARTNDWLDFVRHSSPGVLAKVPFPRDIAVVRLPHFGA